ncbi:unnamed protein product [Arctia plantaginis]|uniref:Fatty acyl-CoA reductase n=1 Tax=Arctia plantaginis TaxID=874455 RepID=A0A8S1AQX9_ARCPL|nr:unnamed protein product [Arctia plantaginis]
MDPAKEVEDHLLSLLKPVNIAIDRGDSAIQQFYRNATIFLTGGSGFIGKQLVEKLCRSCEITKIYLLMRPKKNKTIQQRLKIILNDPVFDELRKKKPQFQDNVVAVEGDVADIRLGLSDMDWTMLAEEVNFIFHVAATVRFDEPLKVATLINVRGPREALQLAKECKNFKCFTHTSTAYAHATISRINGDVEEKFYQCPFPPEELISMAETMDENQLYEVVASAMNEWPNTYTFTKAIGEEVIRTSGQDLPKCIVKPPVVTSTYLEPAPGWIDSNACLSSPVGFMLGAGLGILHIHLIDKDLITCYAPVDFVNNAIIAAPWDTVEKKANGETEVPIYTVSTSGCKIKWRLFSDYLRLEETLKLASSVSVWYCFGIETTNNFVYWLLTWLLHYIPGYIIDGFVDLLRIRPKGIPPLMKVYRKLYKITKAYQYFCTNNWNFRDDNLKAMIQRMTPQDRIIYNCDVTTINFDNLLKAWIIGLRKFIVKDGLRGSDIGYKKQKYYFKYANIVFMCVYGYLIYITLTSIFKLLAFIVLFAF